MLLALTYINVCPIQDQLESLFDSVRGRGGSNWNPTALEAKGRLRLLMLQCVMKTGQNPLGLETDEHPVPQGEVSDRSGAVLEEVSAVQEKVARAELEESAEVASEMASFAPQGD